MLYPHMPVHIPSVENRIIDSNHRKMFDIVRRIQSLIMAKDCTAIAVELQVIENFARTCFSLEEEIARAVGFDFTLHNLAHQNWLRKCRQLGNELATRNGSWSDKEGEAFAQSLNDSLMTHVDYESRPLMCVLDTYYYDFKPAEMGS